MKEAFWLIVSLILVICSVSYLLNPETFEAKVSQTSVAKAIVSHYAADAAKADSIKSAANQKSIDEFFEQQYGEKGTK